ncbi:MAG: FAD-binding protein, partial [Nocardioidaceae bacterium]
ADVDITQQPMEVSPTCHYVMGGVEVDPDSQQSLVPGLYAVGEVAGGMHGSNRLGGNSLGDLLVFGRRAGAHAAEYAAGRTERPAAEESELADAERVALAPFGGDSESGDASGGENPYTVHQELQKTMQGLVGIIRTGEELQQALDTLQGFKQRVAATVVEGNRQYNPGWHLAIDLHNMLLVSECIARAALERTESRGGHTRNDFPQPDEGWGKKNIVCRTEGDGVAITTQLLPEMPDDLKQLFEEQ